jgi:hypothetical protein
LQIFILNYLVQKSPMTLIMDRREYSFVEIILKDPYLIMYL